MTPEQIQQAEKRLHEATKNLDPHFNVAELPEYQAYQTAIYLFKRRMKYLEEENKQIIEDYEQNKQWWKISWKEIIDNDMLSFLKRMRNNKS